MLTNGPKMVEKKGVVLAAVGIIAVKVIIYFDTDAAGYCLRGWNYPHEEHQHG